MADHAQDRSSHDPPGRPRPDRSRQVRIYAAAAVAVLALILIVQNSQSVQFRFFFAETNMPLVFGLLIAFALGALVGWLLPRVRGGGGHTGKD